MHLRLALYSDQEVPANAAIDERLLTLIGVSRPRIGYVSSAPDPERLDFERKRAYYAHLGADLCVFLDASDNDLEGTLPPLFACDALHLSGGNTFSFLRWLRSRAVLPLLRRYATHGHVLIGASAGAILMTPSVGTASLCGDARDPALADDTGLDLVGFHFWPHYSEDAETQPSVASCLSAFETLCACPDGSGLIVDGTSIEPIGPVRVFSHGIPRTHGFQGLRP